MVKWLVGNLKDTGNVSQTYPRLKIIFENPYIHYNCFVRSSYTIVKSNFFLEKYKLCIEAVTSVTYKHILRTKSMDVLKPAF